MTSSVAKLIYRHCTWMMLGAQPNFHRTGNEKCSHPTSDDVTEMHIRSELNECDGNLFSSAVTFDAICFQLSGYEQCRYL